MIRSYPEDEEPWSDATWIDLSDATEAERRAVEKATSLRVPTHHAISEIETTSRVYTENGAMYLSTPLPASPNASEPLSAVGFVLTQRVLITVRFSKNPVFESLFKGCQAGPPHSACDVFMRVMEALIDRSADTLEHCSAELEALSHSAFHSDTTKNRGLKHTSAKLRAKLRKLGQIGDHISQIRDTLLGLGRIAAFVAETGHPVLTPDEGPRIRAVRADVISLTDYEQHLAGKVQFLLDATLGFINIEQNDIVKTLTIVSVVGVPPVLVGGVYGMNFEHMPELHWAFGYPFALVLMVVTGLLPLVWFKWRGWM